MSNIVQQSAGKDESWKQDWKEASINSLVRAGFEREAVENLSDNEVDELFQTEYFGHPQSATWIVYSPSVLNHLQQKQKEEMPTLG